MFKKVLIQTDLTPSQAEILEYLYQNKEGKASEIAKKIKRSRAIVYKEVEELAKLGIVLKKERPNQVAVFMAGHPSLLNKLIEKREVQLKKDKELLDNYLPDMISSFNLLSNRPGVKYYEDKEGVMNVLNHIAKNFKPDTEIISFVKVLPSEFEKELSGAFVGFIKKRNEMNVKTRVIAIDTPEGKKLKEDDGKSLRETRLAQIKNLPLDFPGGEIFIYGEEICAVMMEKNTFFAFTVQNKSISQLLKAFFEAEWELLSGDTTLASSSFKPSEAESFSKTA